MQNLVINPKLMATFEALAHDPAHAILLTGPLHGGKNTLIHYLAKKIAPTSLNIFTIQPLEDKNTISIDQIRDIKKVIRAKDSQKRIFCIPDADLMGFEAQNSLLKILEEPPANVIFLMTTSYPERLLETVKSRVTTIMYISPPHRQIEEYVSENSKNPQINPKIMLASGGKMGAVASMCEEGEEHYLLKSIDLAKDVLSESVIERLQRVDQLSKNQTSIKNLLESLQLISKMALSSSIKSGKSYKAWLQRSADIESAIRQIDRNVFPKLVLDRLFLVL